MKFSLEVFESSFKEGDFSGALDIWRSRGFPKFLTEVDSLSLANSGLFRGNIRNRSHRGYNCQCILYEVKNGHDSGLINNPSGVPIGSGLEEGMSSINETVLYPRYPTRPAAIGGKSPGSGICESSISF